MSPFDLNAILPELILTVTGLTLMLFGAFQKNGSGRGQSTVALLGVAAAAFAVLKQRRPELVYTEMFSIDPFGNFFRVLFLVIAALVILCSADYLRRERL